MKLGLNSLLSEFVIEFDTLAGRYDIVLLAVENDEWRIIGIYVLDGADGPEICFIPVFIVVAYERLLRCASPLTGLVTIHLEHIDRTGPVTGGIGTAAEV